jgi:membrane protein implicated in regulation of membrane protease activity
MDWDPTLLTWIFLAGGLLMLFLEVFVPGGVALFLGLGGLVVGLLRFMGLLADPFSAVVAWALLSAGLTVALRPVALRYFGGTASVGITDEDAEAMGQHVTVVEPVSEDEPGRIRFRGATWDARSMEGTLPEGAEARIVYRDNLTWIVEATDHSALDQELAEAIGSDRLDEPSSESSLSESETSESETSGSETSGSDGSESSASGSSQSGSAPRTSRQRQQ